MNLVDKQKIDMNRKETDQLIVSLLIASIAANRISTQKQIELELRLKYKDEIDPEILKAELKKNNDDFISAQYDLIAEIMQRYSNTQNDYEASENPGSVKQENLVNTFALGFIAQKGFLDLNKKVDLLINRLDQQTSNTEN